MNSRDIARLFCNGIGYFNASIAEQELVEILDVYADEQVEAIVSALVKSQETIIPKDRMRHIVDICRDASLTKRGK